MLNIIKMKEKEMGPNALDKINQIKFRGKNVQKQHKKSNL